MTCAASVILRRDLLSDRRATVDPMHPVPPLSSSCTFRLTGREVPADIADDTAAICCLAAACTPKLLLIIIVGAMVASV